MNKLFRIGLLAITTAFMGTGCLSSAYHMTGENEFPYNATTDCSVNCLGVWGHEPKNEVENAMDAYTKMVYPFWIVDFPLEVVADTAFMPFDAILMCCDDGNEENEKGKSK